MQNDITMADEPFTLSVDHADGGFFSAFRTQDEAEARLLEWARSQGFTDEGDDLLEVLEEAGVWVFIGYLVKGDRYAVPLVPFERPMTVRQ
jgi:hypothetical protein